MASTTIDRRIGVNSQKAMKVPVKVAVSTNTTLSGEQTLDGVACVTGDRVLLWGQTTGTENGIWVVDTSSWTRALDFDDVNDVSEGTWIPVNQGSTYAGRSFRVTTTGTITPGTTSIALTVAQEYGVNYPILAGETGVTNLEYKYGDWKRYGAKGDGVTDDTAAIQNAFTSWNVLSTSKQFTVNTVLGTYTGITYGMRPSKGEYKITSAITINGYNNIVPEDKIVVVQDTLAEDIFVQTSSIYNTEIKNIAFIGGKNAISVGNNNTDTTLILIENCEFQLQQDYSILTTPFAPAQHMSANLTIRKCKFIKPNKVLKNVCDSAIIEDSWVYVDKANFDADSAAIYNGAAAGGGGLYLHNFFGVPVMGTGGGRLATVRWIDNYSKASIRAYNSRFGAEDSGMPVVYHHSHYAITSPYIGNSISFIDCEIYAGPSGGDDSGIIVTRGEVPQHVVMRGCQGPSDVAIIRNPTTGTNVNFSTYFSSAWDSANADPSLQYKFDINGNLGWGNAITGHGIIPDELGKYVVSFRGAQVRRATNQSIAQSTATKITFDVEDIDNAGSWTSGGTATQLIAATSHGVAHITGYVKWDTTLTAGGEVKCEVLKNNTTVIYEHILNGNAAVNWTHPISVRDICDLDDYYEIRVTQAPQAAGANCTARASIHVTPIN